MKWQQKIKIQENVSYTQENTVNRNQSQEGLDVAVDFTLAIRNMLKN